MGINPARTQRFEGGPVPVQNQNTPAVLALSALAGGLQGLNKPTKKEELLKSVLPNLVSAGYKPQGGDINFAGQDFSYQPGQGAVLDSMAKILDIQKKQREAHSATPEGMAQDIQRMANLLPLFNASGGSVRATSKGGTFGTSLGIPSQDMMFGQSMNIGGEDQAARNEKVKAALGNVMKALNVNQSAPQRQYKKYVAGEAIPAWVPKNKRDKYVQARKADVPPDDIRDWIIA